MAAGDKFVVKQASLANSSFLTVQPGAGTEVVIHNILVPAGAVIGVTAYDGTNEVEWHNGSGPLLSHHVGLTNADYMRVQNLSGGAIDIVVQGVVTK